MSGSTVESTARGLRSLLLAAHGVEEAALALVDSPYSRGYFRPQEEERLFAWFARFLTIREGLWQVVAESSAHVEDDLRKIEHDDDWRAFVCGYSAACLIVRFDRLLVDHVATDSSVQRKLNEGDATHRIPRKLYTEIFASLSRPGQALVMLRAMRFAARHRRRLRRMIDDEVVGFAATALPELETALDASKRRFLRLLLGYRRHSLRRRGASARQRTELAALEAGGRLLASLRDRWSSKRVDERVRGELTALLRPGDVLVTRHRGALTNLVLPGFWPHVALYVGSLVEARRLGAEISERAAAAWRPSHRTLEALKDGVLFRDLEATLRVDAVAVIRPRLSQIEVARGLERAAEHVGKLYNFDFDFFRGDRLVCTELVYRAFDGLGGIDLQLTERSGRPTLSAEDLLDLALAGRGFEPLAVFGVPGAEAGPVCGEQARPILEASYLRGRTED